MLVAMTPADERIVQLLGRWQASLELHARYLDLPDSEYQKVQAWPPHQRPNRMVVTLARQRIVDLQRIVQGRIAAGDPSLSEALELMAFLATLVGSQGLERFIPLAEPRTEPGAAAPRARTRKAASTADQTQATAIIKDAVRLLSWGKEWHELPEAIARIAGRPDRTGVQKVLKARREEIERRLKRADDR